MSHDGYKYLYCNNTISFILCKYLNLLEFLSVQSIPWMALFSCDLVVTLEDRLGTKVRFSLMILKLSTNTTFFCFSQCVVGGILQSVDYLWTFVTVRIFDCSSLNGRMHVMQTDIPSYLQKRF